MAEDDISVRLRLRDAKRFQQDADASAKAIRGIGSSAEQTGRRATALQRLQSMGQSAAPAMYALGRASTIAAVGVGVAGAAAVKTGVGFNATMEQNTVAFTNFLGSAGKARQYLDGLYQLAATTPFEFTEVTDAARKFLAFGFTAKQTTGLLRTVGDAVAGIGGGAEEINRITMAFGQMGAKGKVQTEEVLQLAELGIPAFDILRKKLGLTGEELESKLRAGAISAGEGIAALQSGMNATFGGAAAKQAQTFSGQLSTMKDNAIGVMGELTRPIFEGLRGSVLPRLNEFLGRASDFARGGGVKRLMAAASAGAAGRDVGSMGGMEKIAGQVGKVAGTIGRAAMDAGRQLIDALEPAMPFLRNVLLPLLSGLAKGLGVAVVGAFKVAVPVIRAFATVLGLVGTIAAPFRPLIEGIGGVLSFVFGGLILRAIGMLGRFGGVFRVVGGAARVLALPLQFVGRVLGGLISVGGRAASFLAGRFPAAWARVTGAARSALGFFAGLPGRFLRGAVAIVSAVGRGLASLGSRALGAFRSGFGRVMGFLGGLGSRMLNAGRNLISKIAEGIRSAPGALLNALKRVFRQALASAIGVLPGPLESAVKNALGVEGLARGGVVGSGGVALVGERGPELLALPAGATVAPTGRAARTRSLPARGVPDLAAFAHQSPGGDIVVHSRIYLGEDGTREIARTTGRHTADRLARR